MKRKIRIGVPNKGRLREPCLDLLDSIGLTALETSRKYISKSINPNFEIVFTRAFDIPIYVEHGSIDLGLTGYDLVLERDANIHNLKELQFGNCRLIVAVPNESSCNSIADINGLIKISTEYPRISSKYFQSFGIQTEIFELRGAAELAPKLGLSDIIVDLVSTGETLRKNGLRIISTILASSCTLVCNKLSYRLFETEIKDIIQAINKQGGYNN